MKYQSFSTFDTCIINFSSFISYPTLNGAARTRLFSWRLTRERKKFHINTATSAINFQITTTVVAAAKCMSKISSREQKRKIIILFSFFRCIIFRYHERLKWRRAELVESGREVKSAAKKCSIINKEFYWKLVDRIVVYNISKI